MSVGVEWLADNRVCFVTLPDMVSDDEMQNHDSLMMQWLDSTQENCYIIVDVTIMRKGPPLNQALYVKYIRHPRLMQVLTVGFSLNPMARFMVSMVLQIVRLQHKDFATREEAVAYVMGRI